MTLIPEPDGTQEETFLRPMPDLDYPDDVTKLRSLLGKKGELYYSDDKIIVARRQTDAWLTDRPEEPYESIEVYDSKTAFPRYHANYVGSRLVSVDYWNYSTLVSQGSTEPVIHAEQVVLSLPDQAADPRFYQPHRTTLQGEVIVKDGKRQFRSTQTTSNPLTPIDEKAAHKIESQVNNIKLRAQSNSPQ